MPYTVVNTTITPQRTSVRIKVEMSVAGIFQCGVYKSTATSPVSLFNVVNQGHKTTTVATKTVLSITGLIASTDYKLFCLTKTKNNALTTSYQRMMENEMSFTTLCCRHITATLVTKDVSSEQTSLDVLNIKWDMLPSANIYVNLTTNYRVNSSMPFVGAMYPFQPNNLKLRTTRRSTSFSTAVPANSLPGQYFLDFKISSWDSAVLAKYQLVYATTAPKLTVIDLYEPPAPNVTDSYFSNDGTVVYIYFDSATDRAYQGSGLFDCSAILDFPGASTSECVWETRSLLYVYCDLDSPLKVGDKITLVPNSLKAKCTNKVSVCATWKYSSGEVEYTITTALDAVVPTPSIDAAEKIGSCDKFVLDLSLSGGSGGRLWFPLNITVTSPNGFSVTALQNFYDTVYEESPPTPAGIDLFELGGIYNFDVSVCNFLGKCSTPGDTTHTVEYEPVTRPIAYIMGEAQDLFSKNKLSVKCVAYVRTCSGDTYNSNFFIADAESTAGLSYSWSISKDGEEDTSLASILSSTTGPELFLPSYSLVVDSVYLVTMTVTYDPTGLSTIDTLDITVKADDITAIITGGKEVSLPMGRSTFIDGSSSTDGDISPSVATGVAAGLEFEWECYMSDPLDVDACGVVIEVQSSADVIKITPVDDISFNYVNSTSTITLTVFDDSGRRASTTTVDVTIVAGDAPVILLSAEATRILPSDKLKLFSSVTIESGTSMLWSVDHPSVSEKLTEVALTPIARVESGQGVYQFNLVLQESVLPIRGTLTFSLVAGPSQASIDIVIISPPLPGRLVVSPEIGEELADVYDIATSLWTDMELPITYSFGYVTFDGTRLAVQPRSEDTYAGSTLPAGTVENDYVQTLYVRAFNPLEASDSLTITTKVIKSQATAEELSSIVSEQLTQANGETDSSVVKKIINVASSSMNNVNCSLAPNCTSLNRGSCFKLAGTCGECLSSYVGEDGHHNSMCFIPRNVTNNFDSTCSTDADCQLFQTCNSSTRVCYSPPKTCNFNCNEKGDCIFKNVKTGSELDTCVLGDTSCVARCSCDSGFAGDTCQNSQAEQDAKLKAREDMAAALSDAVATEPLNTPDAVQDLIAMIASLSANPYELTVVACDSIATMVQLALSGISDLNMQYEDLAAIYQTLDDCQTVYIDNGVIIDLNGDGNDGSGRRALQTEHSGQLSTLMNEYVSIVSNGIEGGQDLVGEASENFRTSNYYSSNEQLLTFDVVQTEAEIAANAPKSVVYVSLGSTGASGEVSTSLVESVYKMYSSSDEAAIVGNPLRAQFSRSTISDIITLEFHLVNVVGAVDYGGIRTSNESLTTNCHKGQYRIDNYNCSSGYLLQNECLGNSTASHQLISNCPNSTYLPVCGLIMGGAIYASNPDPLGNVSCSTKSYTNMSVVCECTMYLDTSTNGGGRRRLATEEANTIEVAPVATYVADGAVNTIYIITEVVDSEHWIILNMMICLWCLGIVLAGCFLLKCCQEQRKDAVVATVSDTKNANSSDDVSSIIQSYIDSLFPAVFGGEEKWSWDGIKAELKRHHRHYALFNTSDHGSEARRAVTVIELLTLHTTVFFFLGVFFVAQWPADDAADGFYYGRDMIISLLFIAIVHVFISIPLNIIFQDYINAPAAEVEAAEVREADYQHKQSSLSSPSDKVVSRRVASMSGGSERDDFFQKYVCRWETTHRLPETHLRLHASMTKLSVQGQLSSHSESGIPTLIGTDQVFEYSQLVTVINSQREFLLANKPTAVDAFDEQWGLKKTDISDKVESDVGKSIFISNMKAMQLHLSTKENVGAEIMHEFVLDILGRDTNEALIYKRKTEADFQPLNAVSKASKATAWFMVIGLNIFFLYYTISLGIHRSKDFQLNFVTVCMIQLFLEIVLFETLEVVWVQYVIPRMVLSNIKDGIDCLRNLMIASRDSNIHPLNASEYLFVSTRLARHFPSLLESETIARFSTYLPGAIGDRWTRPTSWIPSNLSKQVGVQFFVPELVLMQYIGTLAIRAQKSIVRLFLPVSILLLILFIAVPVLFVIPALVLLVLVLLSLYLMTQRRRPTVIHVEANEEPPRVVCQNPVDDLEEQPPLQSKMKPASQTVDKEPVEEPKELLDVGFSDGELTQQRLTESSARLDAVTSRTQQPPADETLEGNVESTETDQKLIIEKENAFDVVKVPDSHAAVLQNAKKKAPSAKYIVGDGGGDGGDEKDESPPGGHVRSQISALSNISELPPIRGHSSRSNSVVEDPV